jgi:hypothetical protein
MKQLVLRDRAKEKKDKKPESQLNTTFEMLLTRLCLLKNEDTIDPVKEWDLLDNRISTDRNEGTAKSCILKEHYLICDHIDCVTDLSAAMDPPREYSDHGKISKYILCIGDTLRATLKMAHLSTHGKQWNDVIEEIPKLIAAQRRLDVTSSTTFGTTMSFTYDPADEDGEDEAPSDSDVDSQASSQYGDSDEEEESDEEASQGTDLSETSEVVSDTQPADNADRTR